MLKIRRLNMDTSWQLTWGATSLLIDPWLLGSEVDGFSWFNEQWHATSPVSIDKLADYQGIIVSQSYPDHCHQKTLQALKRVPLLASPKASKRLHREMPNAEIKNLPEVLTKTWLDFGDLQIAFLDPERIIDPIYYGIVIRKGEKAVVYFPHGFFLTEAQIEMLHPYKIELLITSFSLFQLPFFLGGAVNPGKENALSLIQALNPKKVVHTHDENKHAKGLVKKIAKVIYPNPEALKKELAGRFLYLGAEYEAYELG